MARRSLCFRYLITASFLLLGISGVMVCGTGSYFIHQLHGSLTKANWYGPPILLTIAGILNIILGPYFGFFFDKKYNRPQIFMFFMLVNLVAMIGAGAGIWAIIDHGKVDSTISQILEKNLASIGQAEENKLAWNITEIGIKCCGFENLSEGRNEYRISRSCCNSRNYNDDQQPKPTIIETCTVFYHTECRDLALHRYRSILIYTFVVSFCATILQILESIGLWAYAKNYRHKKRRYNYAEESAREGHPRIPCSAAHHKGEHVCECCTGVSYRG